MLNRTMRFAVLSGVFGGMSGVVCAEFDPEPLVVTQMEAPIPEFGPGFFTGISFGSDYGINESGDIALNLGLNWVSPPFLWYVLVLNSGLFVERDGEIAGVAVGGEPIPNGVEGEVFAVRDTRSFNDSGQFAFAVAGVFPTGPLSFDGRGANLFLGDEDGLTLLAKANRPDLSPELPAGTNYLGFGVQGSVDRDGDVRLNNAGDLAFAAVLEGAGVDVSSDELVVLRRGLLSTIVFREGEAAEGLPLGVSYGCVGCGSQSISLSDPRLNADGDVVVRTAVAGPGYGNANSSAIYAFEQGTLRLVAAAGQVRPEEDEFRFLRDPEVNDAGQVLFRGFFGTLASPVEGLFVGDYSSQVSLLEAGADAPGLPGLTVRTFTEDGSSFNRLPIEQPLLNASGDALFAVNVEGPGVVPASRDDRALYLASDSETTLVVQTGTATPGLDETVFYSVGEFLVGGDKRVVFKALIGPAEGAPVTRESLWTWTRESGLSLIVQVGDDLPLGDGQTGEVSFLGFRGGPGMQGGYASPMNSDGVVIFDAALDNETQSGVYRVDLTPSSCGGADIDGNGAVDSDDLGLLLGEFGQTVPAGRGSDVDGDGDVDSDDLGLLLGAFAVPC